MPYYQIYLTPRYFKYISKVLSGVCFAVMILLIANRHCIAQSHTTIKPVESALKLPRFIGDNMVLQRDQPVRVWGWADRNESVTISIGKEKHTAIADNNGRWETDLPARAAGGPFTVYIKTSRDSLTLKNVMFGDVWLCSGQSNMEFQVKKVNNSTQEIQEANYPLIRLLQVSKKGAQEAAADISGGKWQPCDPKTVAEFSAVGYFFGRNLQQNLKIPIGLINATWGGTEIEAWMSKDMLRDFPQKQQRLQQINADPDYIENRVKKVSVAAQNWLHKFYTRTGQIDSAANLLKHPDAENWSTVNLPGFINDQKTAVQYGILWYRKQFDIPQGQLTGTWELNLGQITDVSLIYLNGHKLGESLSRYADNKFAVPGSYLKEGNNELLVYAINEAGPTGFPGDTKISLNDVKNQHTIPLAGQWDFKQEMVEGPKDLLGARPSSSVVSTDYTFLYNGMIAPLAQTSIKGVIWYQGETNASKPDEYEFLLSDLIKGWRSLWRLSDMPFYIVQLANYNAFVEKQKAFAWARLQEVQKNVAFSTKNSGLAVTYDIGNPGNVHPKNKQDVGKRLALIARKNLYNEKELVCYGPIFKKATPVKDSLVISFERSSSELVNSTGSGILNNFMIAGADKVFYPAVAVIRGKNVVAFSNQVHLPVYIRYAFDCNPIDVNFYNSAGLPAIPFRTDNLKNW